MDSSGADQDRGHPPASVKPSPSNTAVVSMQPNEDAAMVASSGPVLPGIEDAPSHTNTPSLCHSSATAYNHASVPPGQAAPCAVPCPLPPPVGSSRLSGVVATDLRSAVEGTGCGCVSPALHGSTPPASTAPQPDSEQPGPSGLPSQRGAVDGASASPRPALLPPAAGTVSERAPCCSVTAAQPCHVLSLPDMRRPRPDCESPAVVSTASPRLSPAAAASSDPTAGQVRSPACKCRFLREFLLLCFFDLIFTLL